MKGLLTELILPLQSHYFLCALFLRQMIGSFFAFLGYKGAIVLKYFDFLRMHFGHPQSGGLSERNVLVALFWFKLRRQ